MESSFFSKDQIAQFPNVRFRYLITAIEGHIMTLTLNRPEKRNAFNPQMANEIAYVLAYANFDPTVRCVVIKAEGPVFCAGADLNAFAGAEDQQPETVPPPLHTVNLGEAFASLAKPSIAQIEGPVLAGGFLILAGVTFAIGVPESHFSLPEVKRGIWPMQVMASLAGLIPHRKLLEMCITGNRYPADQALSMGLLTGVAESDAIQDTVAALAQTVASNAPLAISSGIRAYRKHIAPPATQSDIYRALQTELNELLQTEDAAEGILAFKEKRKADWKNR